MGSNPDSYHILRRLQILAAAGCFLIFLYGLRFPPSWDSLRIFGVGILVAAASLTSGFLLGVVFAIPRDGNEGATAKASTGSNGSTAPSDPNSSQQASDGNDARVRPNSNLVEISDWLTKIIVGVGLVELKFIPAKLGKLSLYLGQGLEGNGKSAVVISGQSAGLAILVFYSTVGFLMGYVWTRLYFSRDLEDQIYRLQKDKEKLEEEKAKLEDEKCLLQEDKKNLQRETEALQQDKARLEDEKVLLQQDTKNLQQDKTKLVQEKEHLKQEKDDFAKDKLILGVEQLIRENQLAMAMKYIDQALADNPRDGRLIMTKARILKRQATPAQPLPEPERQQLLYQAIEYVTRAIASLPGMAEPLYNKACYLALLRDDKYKKEILADLESAFAINPGLKEIAEHDGDLESMQKDDDFKRLIGESGTQDS
jgi:tetratricopeptide (TPR) repeat protein